MMFSHRGHSTKLTTVDNVQSHGGLTGEGYFRHMIFYPLEHHKEAEKGVRMYGWVFPLLHAKVLH